MATTKKQDNSKKPKTTMRERNTKAAADKDKPKKIRRAATTAAKPIGKIGSTLTTEFHIFPKKENPGFFTKSRKMAPSYFRNSASELKNVTWPKRKETWKLVFAVYVFAITLGVAIALIDFGLERLFKEVIL